MSKKCVICGKSLPKTKATNRLACGSAKEKSSCAHKYHKLRAKRIYIQKMATKKFRDGMSKVDDWLMY